MGLMFGALGLMPLTGCESGTTDKDVQFVTVGEAMALRSESGGATIFLDPRPLDAFEAARVPGARSFRLPEVPAGAPLRRDLDEADALIVYGDNPATPSAKGLAKRLIANGYSDVKLLEGGLAEWIAQGGAVERGPVRTQAGVR
jgi:rhodanese-related sulfurtransferase